MNPSSSYRSGLSVQKAPFRTIAELRKGHAALQERTGSQGVSREGGLPLGEIVAFLKAARHAGRYLKDLDDREIAQGIFDFWSSRLIAASPAMADEISSFSLDSAEDNLVEEIHLEEAGRLLKARESIERANAFISELGYGGYSNTLTSQDVGNIAGNAIDKPEVRNARSSHELLIRGVLLHLFTLNENSPDPKPEDLRLKSLPQQERPDSVGHPLAALQDGARALSALGIINEHKEGELLIYSLAHPSLLTEWAYLKSLVAERRRFRAAALLWESRDMPNELLLSDENLLHEIEQHSSLSSLEKKFTEASKRVLSQQKQANTAQEKKMALRLTAFFAALGVAVALGIFAYIFFKDADEQRAESSKISESANKQIQQKKEAAVEYTSDILISGREDIDQAEEEAKTLRNKLAKLASLLPRRDNMPEEARRILNENDPTESIKANDVNASVAQALIEPSRLDDILQPGIAIYSAENPEIHGSANAFLKRGGKVYFFAPQYAIPGPPSTKVLAGRPGIGEPNSFGTIEKQGADLDILSLSEVEVTDPAKVTNLVAGLGPINEIENEPKQGMDVILIGSGSGINYGKIEEIDPKNGNIITTRISKSGDAGAPVVTKSKDGLKLLGVFMISTGSNRSLVVPVSSVMGVGASLHEGAPPKELSGILAEVFFSKDRPTLAVPAQKYVNLLQEKGALFPVPSPQPKTRVPQVKSEVRFYDSTYAPATAGSPPHPDAPATKVMNLLIASGVPANKIRTSYVNDPEAPKNFIQISFAKDGLPP